MSDRRIFRPSGFKRALGWGMILVAGGTALALLGWAGRNLGRLPADEVWSSVGLAAFLGVLVLLGVALLRQYFVLEGDVIEIVRLFRTRRYDTRQLAGFGELVIHVNMVPLLQFKLYGPGLKTVAILPVNLGDKAEIERWFTARLSVVVYDGSPAFPKPRFRDAR